MRTVPDGMVVCHIWHPHSAILNFRRPPYPPRTKLTDQSSRRETIFFITERFPLNIVIGGRGCQEKLKLSFAGCCPLDIMLERHAPTGRCPPRTGKLRANGTFHLGKNGVTRQCGPIRSTKHWIPSGYRSKLARIPWIPSTPV